MYIIYLELQLICGMYNNHNPLFNPTLFFPKQRVVENMGNKNISPSKENPENIIGIFYLENWNQGCPRRLNKGTQ